MKKLLLLLAFVPFLLTSCGGDDDEKIETPKTGEYKVIIHNRINKSAANLKSDGILYDMYLISQNGKIYKTGGVNVGSDLEYTLPTDYDPTKILFIILKIGRNSAEASTSKYVTPEIADGKPLPVIVADKRPFVITINEYTTFSQLKYTYLYEVEAALAEIMASLSKS